MMIMQAPPTLRGNIHHADDHGTGYDDHDHDHGHDNQDHGHDNHASTTYSKG